MNAKEALEKLTNYKCSCTSEKNECKDIIENALQEYDLMKQAKIFVADKKIGDEDLEKLKNQKMFISSAEQCEVKLLFDEETQKKLKAFEIIKEKPATFGFMMDCDVHTYEDYLDILASCNLSLLRKSKYTETEFDLLNEVLK